MFFKPLVYKFLFKYIYEQWNIAIAEMDDNLIPVNIRWMKHDYKDRWFADPFFIDETQDVYVILVEEFLRDTKLGRLARLTIDKRDCKLLHNETILEKQTHLSFPIPITIKGDTFIYPENGASGETHYYKYGDTLKLIGRLSELPLADPVIVNIDGCYYLLATLIDRCNGNILNIFRSNKPFDNYELIQEIHFHDNIARRAGNVFEWNGRLISPAQVCNKHYGEGVSFQEIRIEKGLVVLKEIKRFFPSWKEYNHAFHTYNILRNKVVIDGNYIKWPNICKMYKRIRHIS